MEASMEVSLNQKGFQKVSLVNAHMEAFMEASLNYFSNWI
jgi:hypothetical protein